MAKEKAASAQQDPTPDTGAAENITASPAGSVTEALVLQLLQKINDLEARLSDKAPALVVQGPAEPPRSQRPHIMVFVTEDTCVRVEVAPEYIAEKKPGWDGTPVKGYLNHENSILKR